MTAPNNGPVGRVPSGPTLAWTLEMAAWTLSRVESFSPVVTGPPGPTWGMFCLVRSMECS